jgi:hypothetical protein
MIALEGLPLLKDGQCPFALLDEDFVCLCIWGQPVFRPMGIGKSCHDHHGREEKSKNFEMPVHAVGFGIPALRGSEVKTGQRVDLWRVWFPSG